MIKTAIGLGLAFAIGAACRWADVPVPAPSRLTGALLVLAVTLGYIAADAVIGRPPSRPPAAEAPGLADQSPPPPQRD